MVDDRRHKAKINFGLAASRPRRHVAFLDKPLNDKTDLRYQIRCHLKSLSNVKYRKVLKFLKKQKYF